MTEHRSPKRPRGEGIVFSRPDSRFLWIQYCRGGKTFRESAGTDNRKRAQKLLQMRRAEALTGTLIAPSDRAVKVDELYEDLLANYRTNERASLENTEQRWEKRLKSHFGGFKAVAVTTRMLNGYVDECREEGLSNATINRDLAALKRAFNPGHESTPRKIKEVPNFPHLKEAPPRSGFVEEAEYQKLAQNAGDLWLRALLATAYAFGFRKSELLNLRARQVDLMNRTIRLNRGETKSGESRLVVMTQEVFVLLQVCCAAKSDEAFVFTRKSGYPVRGLRKAWARLTKAAGTPGLLFHDLRRSAVRNMVRSGIPERVAMEISGHKTRAVFDRYNIVSQGDLERAAKAIERGRTENYHVSDTLEPSKELQRGQNFVARQAEN